MIAIVGLLSWHWAVNKAEPERRVHATANCSARRRERWLNQFCSTAPKHLWDPFDSEAARKIGSSLYQKITKQLMTAAIQTRTAS